MCSCFLLFLLIIFRFYSPPYSIAPNRMIAQSSLSPYMPSQVPSYQVHSPSWMHHQSYLMQPTGAVLTSAMDHPMSIQPTSMIGPLTQQLSHLSLGSAGTYIPNAAMQGTYIPQYTPVPPSSVTLEENSGQQQQVSMETPSEHTNYSYQHSKWSYGPLEVDSGNLSERFEYQRDPDHKRSVYLL